MNLIIIVGNGFKDYWAATSSGAWLWINVFHGVRDTWICYINYCGCLLAHAWTFIKAKVRERWEIFPTNGPINVAVVMWTKKKKICNFVSMTCLLFIVEMSMYWIQSFKQDDSLMLKPMRNIDFLFLSPWCLYLRYLFRDVLLLSLLEKNVLLLLLRLRVKVLQIMICYAGVNCNRLKSAD